MATGNRAHFLAADYRRPTGCIASCIATGARSREEARLRVLGFMNAVRYKPGGNYSPRYRTEEKMSHTETQRHGEERDMFLDNDRFGVPRHLSLGSVYGSRYDDHRWPLFISVSPCLRVRNSWFAKGAMLSVIITGDGAE